tara:strand:+ start:1445 stop:2365 length:921 start_codon:yes stop_codon:yes gene_type:complete
MSKKPKLLLRSDKWSNASTSYLEPLFDKYFERVFIDSTATYSPDEYIVYTHCIDWKWVLPWRDRGFKVVIDNLWEHKDFDIGGRNGDLITVINHDDWFFIANECLWYNELGYQNYTAGTYNNKDFLMLMNYQHNHRDMIWEKIQPHLSNSLHSYRDIGVSIDGDIPREDVGWQRYLNQSWYNKTKYSVVVESTINRIFISEKILKPLAFGHPFIVWGASGILEQLRNFGFKTFDNCIDESYDLEKDDNKRLEMIMNEIEILNATPPDYFLDTETQSRININNKRFYNVEWATEQFEKYFNELKMNF